MLDNSKDTITLEDMRECYRPLGPYLLSRIWEEDELSRHCYDALVRTDDGKFTKIGVVVFDEDSEETTYTIYPLSMFKDKDGEWSYVWYFPVRWENLVKELSRIEKDYRKYMTED
jgi:hypothetical protein